MLCIYLANRQRPGLEIENAVVKHHVILSEHQASKSGYLMGISKETTLIPNSLFKRLIYVFL